MHCLIGSAFFILFVYQRDILKKIIKNKNLCKINLFVYLSVGCFVVREYF